MNIYPNRSQKLSVSQKKVGGIKFNAYIKHGTVNTDLANSDFLPENVILSMNLKRNGKNFPVLPLGNLKVLHLDSNFYRASYEKICPNASATIATVLVEKGASAKEVWLYEISVYFHKPFHLINNDELEVEVNFQSSAISSNVDTADTFLEVEAITDQHNYEDSTSLINMELVLPNEVKYEKSYENLADLKFINLDKTDLLYSSAPVIQASMNSQMQTYTDTYYNMLGRRADAFSDVATANKRLQSFDLYDGLVSDRASIVLTLVSGNINAGKNYVVSRRVYRDARLEVQAEAYRQKHDIKRRQALGLSVPASEIQEVARTIASSSTK